MMPVIWVILILALFFIGLMYGYRGRELNGEANDIEEVIHRHEKVGSPLPVDVYNRARRLRIDAGQKIAASTVITVIAIILTLIRTFLL